MALCISSLACGPSLFIKPTGFHNFNGDKNARRKTRQLAHISVAVHQPFKLPNSCLKKVDSMGKWKGKLGNLKCDPISVNSVQVRANSVDWRSNESSREQELVDCDTSCNQGCDGGDRDHAFAFVDKNDGIHRDKDCTRTGKDEKCNTYRNETKVITRIDGYQCHVPANNESTSQKAIFSVKCGTDLDHNVVVVGNGNEAGKDYRLVQNSRGTNLREEDYQRMDHNVEEKTCKCETAMEIPFPIKNGQNPTTGPSHPTRVMPQHQQLFKEESQPPLEQHMRRKLITILCIDGGGVRGIITSEMLAFLEAELQRLDGEDARLVYYFDVIVGTSTGALITAMITIPNEEGRPKFEAKSITDVYLEHASKIFPITSNDELDIIAKFLTKDLWQPKHGGECLRRLIRDVLQDKQLKETLTNVIIPAYDMITSKPVIFSRNQLKNNPSLDAKLFDICTGACAAPTYLPSHPFRVNDAEGNLLRKFNLIDGGLFANNPTQLAINEVINEGSMNGCQLLVLSLGTGSQDFQEKYKATDPSRWGTFKWVLPDRGSIPLMDAFSSSSNYMADYDCATLMHVLGSMETYFRIQDYTLSGDLASLDLATPENMGELKKVAKELLKKPMTRMNIKTCELEYLDMTNEMALIRIAELLHKERKSRMEDMFKMECYSDRILRHIN